MVTLVPAQPPEEPVRTDGGSGGATGDPVARIFNSRGHPDIRVNWQQLKELKVRPIDHLSSANQKLAAAYVQCQIDLASAVLEGSKDQVLSACAATRPLIENGLMDLAYCAGVAAQMYGRPDLAVDFWTLGANPALTKFPWLRRKCQEELDGIQEEYELFSAPVAKAAADVSSGTGTSLPRIQFDEVIAELAAQVNRKDSEPEKGSD